MERAIFVCLFRPNDRLFVLIIDPNEGRGVNCTFERVGDNDAQMLAAPVNIVILQRRARFARRAFLGELIRIRFELRGIFAGDDCNYSRRRFCGRDVDLGDAPFRDCALNQRAVSEIRRRKFGGKFCCAGDLQFRIDARKRLTELRVHVCATALNARTIARLANSILNELCS